MSKGIIRCPFELAPHHYYEVNISAISPTASGRLQEEMINQYEKELELRTKMTEAKYHEEKLQIQQKHDQAIQKVITYMYNSLVLLMIRLYRR